MDRVADVEYTIVDTVSEALLLEATLIKRHQPRFNVRLKDDKSYPYIKVTLGDDFPRIERTRKLPNDGSRYFGPYASASSVDEAMNLIRRLFPFRTCTIEIKDGKRALPRPCLLYHIKRCQGPCIEAISKDDYRADIEQVMLFLEGRQELVVRRLRQEMAQASEATDYERAADMRDKLRAVERTMESQKMAAFARTEIDVLGFARQGGGAAVQLFAIREGTTIARDVFLLENVGDSTDDEALSAFIKQYYAAAGSIPPRVLVPQLPTDASDLVTFLESRRGRRRGACRAAARRAARADGSRGAQRRRDARPASRRAGWPTRARRWRRSRSSPARSACRAAAAHRVLRHLDDPGHEHGRQHGRLRGRAGRAAASTAASGSRPWSRAPTTSPATARSCAAVSTARSRQRRGSPRSCAGGCPTWS